MTNEEALKEAQRLSEIIKNSKVLTNEDMIWFDYLYNISPIVKDNLDLYRREHACTLEEALLKMVVEVYKEKYEEQFKGLQEAIEKNKTKDN